MDKMRRILKSMLLLCLCAVLLTGSALANEVLDISGEGYDDIGHACTLPDGRMIFSGCKGKPGNYMDSKARLLCLNPDKTVSWEYIHPAEGSWGFSGVLLMDDGTLCVRLINDPYQKREEDKLVFFTQDGEPTGREIRLDLTEQGNDYLGYGMLRSGIMTYFYAENDEESYIECSDWDGNIRFRLNGRGPVLQDSLIEEEDGLVFMGNEFGAQGAAKIVKIDWQGDTVWENTVPFMTEPNRGAIMRCGIRTSDGGYLAVIQERPVDFTNSKWKTFLVRFSSTGRVLWTNEESFDKQPDSMYTALEEYNGKYVLQFEDKERFNALSYPVRYLWFDADGRELGMTELYIRKEDLPRLAKSKNVTAMCGSLLVMEDGLWGDFLCCSESSNHENEMASMDELLIKIPEL